MNTSDYQSFVQLFDQMEGDSSLKGAGRQLACIAKLVFYCGVKEGEIPELTIRDVLDKNEKIIMVIRKFDKPITLTDELAECIARHIKEMGSRNPSFVKRRSPLFPAYRNTRKIKRHLKTFGTTYTQIHHAGIHYYYRKGLAAGRSKGWIYKSGSRQKRISARQFQAVATGNKIPAGTSIDKKCIRKILSIFDKAQTIQHDDPSAKYRASCLIDEYNQILQSIRSEYYRKLYEAELPTLQLTLAPFLNR